MSIDERFQEFNAQHPEVYAELVKLAREAKARGKSRVGIKLLWEVVRWNRFLACSGESDFKLNNVYTSRYAREIMRRETDLADLFETRILKTRDEDDGGDGGEGDPFADIDEWL